MRLGDTYLPRLNFNRSVVTDIVVTGLLVALYMIVFDKGKDLPTTTVIVAILGSAFGYGVGAYLFRAYRCRARAKK
jgi:uncharacterized membrane protein YfcA